MCRVLSCFWAQSLPKCLLGGLFVCRAWEKFNSFHLAFRALKKKKTKTVFAKCKKIFIFFSFSAFENSIFMTIQKQKKNGTCKYFQYKRAMSCVGRESSKISYANFLMCFLAIFFEYEGERKMENFFAKWNCSSALNVPNIQRREQESREKGGRRKLFNFLQFMFKQNNHIFKWHLKLFLLFLRSRGMYQIYIPHSAVTEHLMMLWGLWATAIFHIMSLLSLLLFWIRNFFTPEDVE